MPDPEIEDDRPEQPELFISYASADLDRAAALHHRLVAEGRKVWFDKIRLTPGCDWHREIEAGCEAARIILPLITPRWAKSEWTRYETYAHDTVIPVLAEGKAEDVMPPPLRRWNAFALDPLAADEAAWQALFATIRTKLAEPVPERTPRIVDLPYSANPFFTGRNDDLVRIHEELHAAPIAALTQGRVRALAAMGGIGKTTLANEYARRYWRLYQQILWVDARAGLENGFALFFGKLFPGRSDAGLQQPDKAKLVLAELSGRAERLLVLDNVEDAESVRPWLVRDATSGCRMLITSRFADWPAAAGIRSIQLYVLEPAPARRFLLTRTGRGAEGSELTACDDLARELGYLPLALEQAAAYIAAPGAGVDFVVYLRLYREAAAELLARGALGSTEYPDPVITTWQATVAKLSPESRAVLRLCAWYADTPIPRALVMEGAEDILALAAAFGSVTPLSGPAAEELRMRDALTGLARFSMIFDATNSTFRVHGLVQAVQRMLCSSDQRAEALPLASSRLLIFGPSPAFEPDHLSVWDELVPHVRAVLRHGAELPQLQLPRDLFLRLDEHAFGHGNFAESARWSEERLALVDAEFGPESTEVADALINLGESLRELGRQPEAVRAFQRSLHIRRTSPNVEKTDIATSLNYLGMALDSSVEQRALYTQGLALCESAGQPNCMIALKLRHNLASALEDEGLLDEAEAAKRGSLEAWKNAAGAEHPLTLMAMHNLAVLLLRKGEIAEAEELERCALEGRERVLGSDHPQTLTSAGTLARILQAKGIIDKAELLLRRVTDTMTRVLGPNHPNTVTSESYLASCLAEKGDHLAAEPLHRHVLEDLIGKLGIEHPNVLTHQNNLSAALRKAGHPDLAEPYARQCADASARVLGDVHPLAVHRRNNLALTLLMLRRTAEARSLLAANWVAPCPHSTPVIQAVTFLAAIAALLDATDTTDPLGRLKTLLRGPKPQQAPGVIYPWEVDYLLDHLSAGLSSDSLTLLQATLAAINDPAQAPDLDRFPLWRDTPVLPLDTPWPRAASETNEVSFD